MDLFLRPGPTASRHDLGVRGGATAAERAVLPRDGGVRGSGELLQVRPRGLSLQGGGLWPGAAGHGQCV